MTEETQLSARVTTHEVYYKEGSNLRHVRVTAKEAQRAIDAWSSKTPVPIPNLKDPNLSNRLIAYYRVEEITRYRNLK